jgi:chorismate mutase/prephenate dehydratase
MMNISKSYQATFLTNTNVFKTSTHKTTNITVGYQGVEGAFSYQAMKSYFKDVKSNNYNTFEDVFIALKNKEIDYGILPLENSSTGAINDNYDLVRNYGLYIVGEYSLSVSQNLLGIKGSKIEDITDIYSHPQGIFQCSNFLSKYPSIKTHEYSNTAASAKKICELNDKTKGAIASKEAARLYDLDILKEDIHNDNTNHTRFIVVGRDLEDDQSCNCCSIVFTLKHEAGALAGILQTIKDHEINLSRIESRPIPHKNWEYYFYIDLEGSIHNSNVITAYQQLKANALTIKVIGNYKQAEGKE